MYLEYTKQIDNRGKVFITQNIELPLESKLVADMSQ